MSQILNLTQKLISIPSWVDDNCNESQIGEFIYQYMIKNSNLTVAKQFCNPSRFNVIAQNSPTIDLLVIGHIDTVQPSKSWVKNPIIPEISGGKLYGLGSADMKSGLAAMLRTAINPRLKSNTGFLFYVDEEYDFIGMKKFIAEFKNKISPRLIISLDGSDLKITNGCRGLIEIEFTFRGTSGHAARPQSGLNAITTSLYLIDQLKAWLTDFNDPFLGSTSLNVAYISGGQYQGQNQQGLILGKQGNIIADICQFIIDVRPANSSLTAQAVINFVQKQSKKLGLKFKDTKIRQDYQSWLTPQNQLPEINLGFNQIDQSGYLDIQLLWQAFNQVPCFTLGAGSFLQAHKPDEYVEVNKLIKLQPLLDKILINY